MLGGSLNFTQSQFERGGRATSGHVLVVALDGVGLLLRLEVELVPPERIHPGASTSVRVSVGAKEWKRGETHCIAVKLVGSCLFPKPLRYSSVA
jgi:hypothetical protein